MSYILYGLYWLIQIYIWLLLARMVISWIPLIAPRWNTPRFLASIFELIYTLTDPPIRFFNRIIPPLNMGSVSLDLAFMVVFILALILQRVVIGLF